MPDHDKRQRPTATTELPDEIIRLMGSHNFASENATYHYLGLMERTCVFETARVRASAAPSGAIAPIVGYFADGSSTFVPLTDNLLYSSGTSVGEFDDAVAETVYDLKQIATTPPVIPAGALVAFKFNAATGLDLARMDWTVRIRTRKA